MLRALIIVASFGFIASCAAVDQEVPPEEPKEETVLETLPETSETGDAETTRETLEYTRIRFGLQSRDDEPSVADRKRCEEAGGRVQRAGLRGVYQCVQTYPDAGKICRDSKDCLGNCRTMDSAAIGRPGTGTCQEVDVPFGCYALVRDGVVDGGMLCVD